MKKNIVVKKFGGTSVGNPTNMKTVLSIIEADSTEIKIVVLSALSKTTNHLISISDSIAARQFQKAQQLLEDLKRHYIRFLKELFEPSSPREAEIWDYLNKHYFSALQQYIYQQNCDLKQIVSFGEYMSTRIFSSLLEEHNIEHEWLDAFSFIRLDESGQVDYPFIENSISQVLEGSNKRLFITQGFICQNHDKKMDNLQRGGSDFTASILSACVGAHICEIWTDIDGVHNNDPRLVKHTTAIPHLGFDEASELAYFGAKVLHPTCIAPAQRKAIPVKILNTMQPKAMGTVISDHHLTVGVKAIAAKDNIISIRIKSHKMLMAYGFLRQVFELFEKYKTPIDMITTSEVAISLTIDDTTYLEQLKKDLETIAFVEIDVNQTIVCIVGHRLQQSPKILEKIFSTLSDIPIRMISYGGSKNNISLLLPETHKVEVLQLLHSTLF